MSTQYRLAENIDLFVKNRIREEDALRQTKTASAILNRLNYRPGVVLADEVGMGKTFVALAVAFSVSKNDPGNRPVVIMIPPSLKEKWPRDAETFAKRCLPEGNQFTYKIATNPLQFLQALDDDASGQARVIFLTHGALHRGLSDGLAKLAFIKRAIHGRRSGEIKQSLYLFAAGLLYMKFLERDAPKLWEKLLTSPYDSWKKILIKTGHPNWTQTSDDPVPAGLVETIEALNTADFNSLYEALQNLPGPRSRSQSAAFEQAMKSARGKVSNAIGELWSKCIQRINSSLPLLIMDEAHHLKNSETRLASLFESEASEHDANEVKNGTLAGVFERMLFLTATPFQLGHHELCNILRRFEGIAWNALLSPTRTDYRAEVLQLEEYLDRTQFASKRFENLWSGLVNEMLTDADGNICNSDQWWDKIVKAPPEDLPELINSLYLHYNELSGMISQASGLLKHFVIRHLKTKIVEFGSSSIPRREKIIGKGILNDAKDTVAGLGLTDESLLAFLLSARLCALNPEKRPVFAEGLASSYDAFLKTSENRKFPTLLIDSDDDAVEDNLLANEKTEWYRSQIEEAIGADDYSASSHPKIKATVDRAIMLWLKNEKVLIFCHYVETGKTLRRALTAEMSKIILAECAKKMSCDVSEVSDRLTTISEMFEKPNHIWKIQALKHTAEILSLYPALEVHHADIERVIVKYLKSPSFLARYFDIGNITETADPVNKAFSKQDDSGHSFIHTIKMFLAFLQDHCSEEHERIAFLNALLKIQPASMNSADISETFSADELTEEAADKIADTLKLANVRLANGSNRQDTRQRLMLAFNTPLMPDILVASSVMAEGVDLHLSCRHVIHHDLCWNPSMLEQRTGRLDRIGSKMEKCGRSIQVYLPFIAETQDEKMYRVVTDREKWFNIVMGDKFPNDLRTTDKIAERVSLPNAVVAGLMFDLSVC